MSSRQIFTRPRLSANPKLTYEESSVDDSDRENPGLDEPSSPDDSMSSTSRSSDAPSMASKASAVGSSYIKYWSPEEDRALIEAVKKHGRSNWAAIEDEMTAFGRTKSQCSLRWSYNLDPKVNRGPFTPEEDKMLLSAQKAIGNKWKQISEHLKTNRHPIALRHRWVYLINGGSSSEYNSSSSSSNGSSSSQSTSSRSGKIASLRRDERVSPNSNSSDDNVDDLSVGTTSSNGSWDDMAQDPASGKSLRGGSKKRKSSAVLNDVTLDDSLASDAVELLGKFAASSPSSSSSSFAVSAKRPKQYELEVEPVAAPAVGSKEEEAATRLLDGLFGAADQVELLGHIMKSYLDVKLAMKSQTTAYETKISELQSTIRAMTIERQMLEERLAMTQALAMHQQHHNHQLQMQHCQMMQHHYQAQAQHQHQQQQMQPSSQQSSVAAVVAAAAST